MGTSQGTAPRREPRALAALGYLLLFVLGALQGLVGSFQYSQPPSPLIAIVLAAAIFLTCLACGWGIGTFTAGLMPAVGWILASFILAMGRPNGSVIITATTAGECYLYGGALGCAAGVIATVFTRARRATVPR
jgi:hypothetical protein